MLKIEGLKKAFDQNLILNDINMHVEEGNIYGIVGSNGCGKTTILKHIMGIYKGDQGHVLYKDRAIHTYENNQEVYYVQDDLYFPMQYSLEDLFAYEQMMYPKMTRDKFDSLVAYFKLPIDRKLRQLSKGQKKQAAFILAISSGCELILLDEIVDGLDAVVRKKFWQVLLEEVIDTHLTVVISSHALIELDNICDKVAIIHEGRVVKEESIDNLKDKCKRIQFAIEEETFEAFSHKDYVLERDNVIGKVHFLVVRGDIEAFEKDLRARYKVILFEVLQMNLEEVFISELGGLGYGNEIYHI